MTGFGYVLAVKICKYIILPSARNFLYVFTFNCLTGRIIYICSYFNNRLSFFASQLTADVFNFTVLISSVYDDNRCMILSQTRSLRSEMKLAKQFINSDHRSVERHNLKKCVAKSNHKLSTRCCSSFLPSLLSNISSFVLVNHGCNDHVVTTLQ